MKTHLHHILLSATLLLLAISVEAQVGINNPNPHTSAILDLSSTSKGLLIPRMTTSDRTSISDPAPGLMVYDTDDQMYYFKHPDYWGALNPFNFRDGATFRTHPKMLDMNLFEVSSGDQADVGNSPRLWVDGQLIVAGTFERPPGTHGLLVEGDSRFKGNVTFDIQPSFEATAPEGTFGETDTSDPNNLAYKTSFVGYGTIPLGGIIMWSGNPDALPPGWEICDGVQPSPVPQDALGNPIVIPDLRERFIVGAGGSVNGIENDDDSGVEGVGYNWKDKGGSISVTIDSLNMPSHSHDIDHYHFTDDPGHAHGLDGWTGGTGNGINLENNSEDKRFNSTNNATTGLKIKKLSETQTVTRQVSIPENPGCITFPGIPPCPTETVTQSQSHFSATAGKGDPLEVIPPYYALAFIIRVQ